LRGKPDIRINDEALRKLDAAEPGGWYTNFGAWNRYTALLYYKDVPLDFAIRPDEMEFKVYFPTLRDHTVKVRNAYSYVNHDKYGYLYNGESYLVKSARVVTTARELKAVSTNNTDDFYNSIVETHDKYDKARAKVRSVEQADLVAKKKNEDLVAVNKAAKDKAEEAWKMKNPAAKK
jgi:hypothetical protein